jgi:hypothetical protein
VTRRSRAPEWVAATAAYTAIALVLTWPLAARLTRSLASDLGDPVFNCWALMWTADKVLRTLHGDVAALGQYWQGNIFHPAPLTLAWSEHLTPQMLQALPILAATHNAILAYNLLFISTFAGASIAMYYLARDLTGHRGAAFVAGLVFAYSPYRIGQLSHLQVLSSQWMPLAVLGFLRYFETGRPRALAGGAAAWLTQNLSCGYFLLFFSPLLGAYAIFEIARRRLLARWRTWLAVASAALVVGAATLPFVTPYMDVRRAGDVGVRSSSDIVDFSADLRAFVTASEDSRLWGTTLSGYRKPEGVGFPGFAALGLAAIGLVSTMRAAGRDRWRALPIDRRAVIAASVVAIALAMTFIVWMVAAGSVTMHMGSRLTVYRNVGPAIEVLAVAIAALAMTWPRRPRGDHGADPASTSGFWAIAFVVTVALALGPQIEAGGHRAGVGPYRWLLDHVPGFDGLRVPARFLTISTLCLAILSSWGLRAIAAATRAHARVFLAIVAAVVLAEGWMAPLPLARRVVPAGYTRPPDLSSAADLNPIYRSIAQIADAVVIELPIGVAAYDLQAVYYAGIHLRPLVNGYSGFFPPGYDARAAAIAAFDADPAAAAAALRASGATHVIVHERAYAGDRGRQLSRWLESIGAASIGADAGDRLFRLR